ncbi:YolD-like family protein [Cohnella yongneupensis]|uniref:YolD-like family protein n=1 Tax=Cohnella yongneupensis TaxID=425006 RepID=A0ABW0QU26_9BACL
MMLPEHKERIIALNNADLKPRRTRPTLDDQELEEFMRVLMESLGLRSVAEFKLYHEYEDCLAIGVVDKVDPYTRTFLIDGERFKVDDIIGASIIGA